MSCIEEEDYIMSVLSNCFVFVRHVAIGYVLLRQMCAVGGKFQQIKI